MRVTCSVGIALALPLASGRRLHTTEDFVDIRQENDRTSTAPTGYDELAGKCSGSWIETWGDGSYSHYGEAYAVGGQHHGADIDDCANTCSQYPSCHGFYTKEGKCSYWRTGTITATPHDGYMCYKKQNAAAPAPACRRRRCGGAAETDHGHSRGHHHHEEHHAHVPDYTEVAAPPNTLTESSRKEDYLLVVDRFIDNQPRNGNGLLQTYGPGRLGGGSCGQHCELPEECPAKSALWAVNQHCRHDVYDNALAAIYLTKRGKFTEAKGILDAFLTLMYPAGHVDNSYGPDETVSGRRVTLLGASYTGETAMAGDYWTPKTTAAGSFVDTGNNAWAGMAFSRYAAATGDACYATAARDILQVLRGHRCDDEMGGFMGRLKPTNSHYRSIEHNIDMFSFARMLGATEDQESAQNLVQHMYFERDQWFHQDGAYVVGTKGDRRCDRRYNHGPIPTDAQIWSAAAAVETNVTRERTALAFAAHTPGDGCVPHSWNGRCHNADILAEGTWTTDTERIGGPGGEGVGEEYEGMRFANVGFGIQWEITASGIIAMARYKSAHGDAGLDLNRQINAARDSVKRLLRRYSAVPASVRGGNLQQWRFRHPEADHPGGSDTGLGWTYLRYPHVASTVWSGLMLIQQDQDGAPIDPEGNPFAPPSRPVPAATTRNLECMR